MKRVEVRLNLEAVAPLLDVIKAVADDLRDRLAVRAHAGDPDLAGEWNRELLQGQGSDLDVLLALFGSEFFATGVIALEPANAEPVLRSCTAVRLRLREQHLQLLGDEALESGEMSLDGLDEASRRALGAYIFLATLQEVVIQHLDPNIGG